MAAKATQSPIKHKKGRLILPFLKSFLIWGSVFVTILSGFFFFLPRVTVDAPQPYDPKNPIPVTFTISNINIVPLRNVQPVIKICYLAFMDMPLKSEDCGPEDRFSISYQPWLVKWLNADEKYEIAIEDAIRTTDNKTQIEKTDIIVAIEYTPWFMPWFWRSTKEFRFKTQKLSDGKIHWTPIPVYWTPPIPNNH